MPLDISQLSASVPNPILASRIRNYPWDNFDAVDGTAINGRVTPSGHMWAVSGAGESAAAISNKGYNSNGNTYAYLTDSQNVVEAEGIFSWDGTGAGGVGTQATICLFSGALLGAGMLHLNFTPTTWVLLYSTTGAGALIPFPGSSKSLTAVPLGGWYGGPLRQDGTKYKIRLVANTTANTLTCYLPDGQIVQFYGGSYVSAAIGENCFWQTSGGDDLRWHACSIGPSKAAEVFWPDTCKDALRLAQPYSLIGARQQIALPQPIILTADGWYTIAQQVTFDFGALMGGSVHVNGFDSSGRRAAIVIDVGAEDQCTPPSLAFSVRPLLGSFAGGIIVDQVRLSGDGAGHLNLDVHLNTPSTSGTLYAFYDGLFAPVATPVVGATALTAFSDVLLTNPSPDPYQPNQRVGPFALTAAGWYTIAKEVPLFASGAWVYMAGHLKFYASDVSGSRGSVGEVLIEGVTAGQTPVITRVYNQADYVGFCVDQIRASTDDSGHHGQLDIHFNPLSSDTGTATCWLDGFFTPNAAPVVGATALATASTVLNTT